MKKQLRLIFMFFMATTVSSLNMIAQVEQYSKVKIYANHDQLIKLAKTGIDVTEGTLKHGESLISDYSESEIHVIKQLGIKHDILIEDVSRFYAERNIGLSTNPDDYKGVCEWEVPDNFAFGSMGGHCTYDEVVAHLDNMAFLFPDLITTKESIGQSIENRDLWMVKISDNPAVNETEPEVLYTAIHHAREPAGVMTILFYMYYLLENYDNDPLIQHIVGNTELYFVPVVNPDGYVYNEQISPNGGGMWRKNRRDNGIPGCEGVDPNRNYGYLWGMNDIGSSPDPCDECYRGDSAWSEPEIVAIRDLCELHEFAFALNYHTYGNLLLYPWGNTSDPCPENGLYHAYSTMMTEENNYPYGSIYNIIYPTNGDATDWMYGEQATKEKTYSFLPELGTVDDGFWCPVDRIIPIAQENMIQNIRVALFPGIYALAENNGSLIIEEESGYLNFNVKRYGIQDGGTFTVSLEPVSENIFSTGDPKFYTGLDLLETVSDSISFILQPSIPGGTYCEFLLSVDNGYFTVSDTISKIFGEPVVLFEDACDDMSNWWSPFWDVTTSTYHSPPGSITDSPYGHYPNNSIRDVIMTTGIDIPGSSMAAILNFYARWEIEDNYDFVQPLISTDGMNWTALEGNYSVPSTVYQSQEPISIYEGFQSEWVLEEFNLTNYIGENVSFKFILKSNDSINEDGFYFDELSLKVISQAVLIEEFSSVEDKDLALEVFPNPANELLNIRFRISGDQSVNLKICNLHSQELMIMVDEVLPEGEHIIPFDVSSLKSGIYICSIKTSEGKQTKKIIKL